MEFKSKLAQEAYDDILKKHDDVESRLNVDAERLYAKISPYDHLKLAENNAEKTIRILARAIEVAAKIEIEEMRAENEQTAIFAKAGLYPVNIQSECEHEFRHDTNSTSPTRYCQKCGAREPRS